MGQTDQRIPLVVPKCLENSLNEPVEPENIFTDHTDHVMITGMKTKVFIILDNTSFLIPSVFNEVYSFPGRKG